MTCEKWREMRRHVHADVCMRLSPFGDEHCAQAVSDENKSRFYSAHTTDPRYAHSDDCSPFVSTQGVHVCVIVKLFKEKYMKNIAILLLVFGSLLSGCVAYDNSYRHGRVHQERERDRDHDDDRDGVPNSQDRRPDDASRY
jgi:hypothetical protein